MDYSLSQAMGYKSNGLRWWCLLYDINCQYGVHLEERFRDNPFLRYPPGIQLWKGIGLFHVHGHQQVCLPRYAPSYMPGAGLVDGEILETMWSSLNKVAGSTRTMGISNRQETLDRHMNDWNWKKMITIGELCLVSKVVNCSFLGSHNIAYPDCGPPPVEGEPHCNIS